MGGGGDLGQGSEGEATSSGGRHSSRVRSRCFEGQSIVCVIRDSPELLSPVERVSAAGGKIDEIIPIARRAHSIDYSQQLGRVVRFDGINYISTVAHLAGA